MDFQVGENIRKIRELRGFSQDYMAQQLKVSQKTYSNIETDKKKIIDREMLFGISEVLSVDPVKLLTFDEGPLFNNVFWERVNVSGMFNTVHNNFEEERKLFEKQLKKLEEENLFLKERINFLESLIKKERN